MTNANIDRDDELTVDLPAETMRDLVFGAPARKPARIRARLAMLLVALGLAAGGCATAPRPVEVESVGDLHASATHVYQAPVHPSTDLSIAYQPAGGDDDAAPAVSGGAGESVEAPEVAAKGGLVVGGAR